MDLGRKKKENDDSSMDNENEVPLLEEEASPVPITEIILDEEEGKKRRKGSKASWGETVWNIMGSIVGTGALGLPFAFKLAGWLSGSIAVVLAAVTTHYCMLLLVECREELLKRGEEAITGCEERQGQEEEEGDDDDENERLDTYGDLGAKAWGKTGRLLTDTLILVSQCGGAVSYLVFVGQNLLSVFNAITTTDFSYSTFIFLLVPIEIALSGIRSLSSFAPFSALADLCNVLAMAVVVKNEILHGLSLLGRRAVASASGLPFAAGVAIFCFEGFSMTLPIVASMKERRGFRSALSIAFSAMTTLYASFGLFGYLAYGDETEDIITLNLPNDDWSAIAVKMGLCFGLTFSFPMMMHPVHQIVEGRVKRGGWLKEMCYDNETKQERTGLYVVRAATVVAMGLVASLVPGFGAIISVVGGTFCALLSFVLPAAFHLIFLGSTLDKSKKAVDLSILILGLLFACYATYAAISSSSLR